MSNDMSVSLWQVFHIVKPAVSRIPIIKLLFEYDYKKNENEFLVKWLRERGQEGSYIHQSIDFTGIKPIPFDLLKLHHACTIERDVTLWLSPDLGADSRLEINYKAYIGRNTYIGVFQPISIGKYAQIGAYSYIISANHCYETRDLPIMEQGFVGSPIVIEDEVWLGTHVVVLPGVTIGKGAIVAAHSLVNKDIPPYEIWGGVPAKFLKHRP